MDTKEKNSQPLEPTDADYIMFNHDVLRACWDLMIIKKIQDIDRNLNNFNVDKQLYTLLNATKRSIKSPNCLT